MVRWPGRAAFQARAPRVLLCVFFASFGGANACTTNHDALVRRAQAGGSAGVAAGGAGGFVGGGFGNVGNSAAQGGRRNPDDEPRGDDVLTLVHGVVDAPSVSLCFARISDNSETRDFVGVPSRELGYAASMVLTGIAGLSLADDAIQPWVIAGELSRLKKLDCQAAIELAQREEARVTPPSDPNDSVGAGGADGAGGLGGANGEGQAGAPAAAALELPALRARPMAALPAGTVDIGRSILLVMTGCLGGAAYSDPNEQAVCGASYRPSSPTLSPLIVKLSRDVAFDKVGLQAVHASLATGSLEVRASGDGGAVALVFARGLNYGSIDPRPADTRFTTSELGVTSFNYGLQAVGEGGAAIYQATWSDILERAGIDAIVGLRTYTAIFLGPDPRRLPDPILMKKGFWNAPAFALIDNDPTRKP